MFATHGRVLHFLLLGTWVKPSEEGASVECTGTFDDVVFVNVDIEQHKELRSTMGSHKKNIQGQDEDDKHTYCHGTGERFWRLSQKSVGPCQDSRILPTKIMGFINPNVIFVSLRCRIRS